MTNHPNRSTAVKKWTIRIHKYFPITDAGEARAPENTYFVFFGTHREAVARYDAERASNPRNVQVTLYGSGPRVREARGTADVVT